MSVLIEFSIFPMDRGESVSPDVAAVIRMIRDSGAEYRLTPMGTIIETATIGEALAFVERAHALLEARGCGRIYATAKIDSRAGRRGGLEGKVAAVRSRLDAGA